MAEYVLVLGLESELLDTDKSVPYGPEFLSPAAGSAAEPCTEGKAVPGAALGWALPVSQGGSSEGLKCPLHTWVCGTDGQCPARGSGSSTGCPCSPESATFIAEQNQLNCPLKRKVL